MERKIEIMGILNLTDDSYFAGSRCPEAADALDRMGLMLSEGADIVDIGACSTRPGSQTAGAEEEWRRLSPVLVSLRREYPDARISIDTFREEIVRKAYDLVGEFTVNDISAGEDDPEMLRAVGELKLPYIAMHKRGTPRTMQGMCDYDDVTSDVVSYFEDFAHRAHHHGIGSWVLDPGFGFAKTVEQNYSLLSRISEFKRHYHPYAEIPKVLVGISRKSMIYKFLDITPEESLPATQVLHLKALQGGADILRVHDVAEAVRTVKLYHAMLP